MGTLNLSNGVSLSGTGSVYSNNAGSWSDAPAGTVIQVVNASTGTDTTSSSATYADTGLTATITPISASSKIAVLVQQSVGTNGNGSYANVKLQRNGTDLASLISIGYQTTGGANYTHGGFNYLDSPATTSALTYKTVYNKAGGTQARVQSDGSLSTIILMEIAQ